MKNNTKTITSIIIATIFIFLAFWFSGGASVRGGGGEMVVAKIENGKQIVDMTARGGYFPKKVKAKSGMPTLIRMTTNGTFDCSSYLVIPSIDWKGNLPQSGVTEIPVPPQVSGSTLNGTCGMGMYGFSIYFE